MNALTSPNQQIGKWSAWTVFFIGVAFVLTGAAGLAFTLRVAGRDPLEQIDPYLAILESLMILAAPAMVVLMAAVHSYAPREVKTYSLAALGFMLLLAGMTSSIHFVQLTVVRRLESADRPPLSLIFFSRWPSVLFALDLLAWDFFLGLSLLCAARVFSGSGSHKAVRVSLLLSGALCLAGLLGPTSGKLWLQLMGITGYAFVFPVACLLLARLFAQPIGTGLEDGKDQF